MRHSIIFKIGASFVTLLMTMPAAAATKNAKAAIKPVEKKIEEAVVPVQNVTAPESKVSLLCEIQESFDNQQPKALVHFWFYSAVFPTLKEPQKDLMAFSTWLSDGRNVLISEADEVNGERWWKPAFLMKNTNQPRHYAMIITAYNANQPKDFDIARIPVEEIVKSNGPVKIDIGRPDREIAHGASWQLICEPLSSLHPLK